MKGAMGMWMVAFGVPHDKPPQERRMKLADAVQLFVHNTIPTSWTMRKWSLWDIFKVTGIFGLFTERAW